MIGYTDTTPIASLTVGELKEILADARPTVQKIDATAKRYVYGLEGIEELFGVSHVTAQRYNATFLKQAVSQRGRKIVVDADLAMELFKNWREK